MAPASPLTTFKQRKAAFDDALHHLNQLSQCQFGLADTEIRHTHCAEILYYHSIIGDLIQTILERDYSPQ